MVFLYLGERFLKRLHIFLVNWYVKGTKRFLGFLVEILRKLDKTFAWKITLENIFIPLYKDYSIQGYILGFILRMARLITASVVYVLISFFVLGVYILWFFVPIYLFFYSLGIIYA